MSLNIQSKGKIKGKSKRKVKKKPQFSCPKCGDGFAHKSSLTRHDKDQRCRGMKDNNSNEDEDKDEDEDEDEDECEGEDEVSGTGKMSLDDRMLSFFSSMQKKMEEDRVADKEEIIQEMRSLISNQASSSHVNNNVNNQNLQVMCLTARDDLLDILQESSGQFKMKSKEALTFIKGCAISRLAGDCRLIERIYIKRPYPALMYGNKSKTQFVYYNEKKERTVETNARVIAKMLADNAQRSYLKGSSSMKDSDGEWISANEDHPLIPMTDPYDKQIWNSHIYELNDQMYQKKLLNSIRIPFESEVLKGNHEI